MKPESKGLSQTLKSRSEVLADAYKPIGTSDSIALWHKIIRVSAQTEELKAIAMAEGKNFTERTLATLVDFSDVMRQQQLKLLEAFEANAGQIATLTENLVRLENRMEQLADAQQVTNQQIAATNQQIAALATNVGEISKVISDQSSTAQTNAEAAKLQAEAAKLQAESVNTLLALLRGRNGSNQT